jgi:hypothetical protein
MVLKLKPIKMNTPKTPKNKYKNEPSMYKRYIRTGKVRRTISLSHISPRNFGFTTKYVGVVGMIILEREYINRC